jgi:Glycosyl hydrolases family 18
VTGVPGGRRRSGPTRWAGPRLASPLLLVLVLLAAGCEATPDPSSTTAPVATVEPAPTASSSPTPPPEPGREIFGFVPYWEMDQGIADHLAATPLTTLALFSVTHTAKGAINTGKGGYQQITGAIGRQLIREAHERGARVELVYTSFGTARNRRLLERATLQAAVTASLVALADDLGVDGINVDLESLDPRLVPAYGEFVDTLRTALRAGGSARQLSVATTANALGAAMALAAVEGGADRVFMMAYNYRTAGSSPGATTPIARRDGSEKDLTWSLDLYAALGVPPQRTILGLPLYGYAWPVVAPAIGSPETGPGVAWIPRRHLDLLNDPAAVPLHDDVEAIDVYVIGSDGRLGPPTTPVPSSPGPVGSPPSSFGTATPAPSLPNPKVTWQAIYVDSPQTLAAKIRLGLERGFAGVGFWAIGYERGLPGYAGLMRDFAAGAALP